jgi:hypothetical protein
MASLRPWSEVDICERFALDYGEEDGCWLFRGSAIGEFMRSGGGSVALESAA